MKATSVLIRTLVAAKIKPESRKRAAKVKADSTTVGDLGDPGEEIPYHEGMGPTIPNMVQGADTSEDLFDLNNLYPDQATLNENNYDILEDVEEADDPEILDDVEEVSPTKDPEYRSAYPERDLPILDTMGTHDDEYLDDVEPVGKGIGERSAPALFGLGESPVSNGMGG